MKKTNSISVLHVIFLSMTVIGLKNHVTIIPSLVQGAGRDGWISILVAVIIIFPWLFLVLYIHKKSKRQPLTEWLEKSTGKVASVIIRYMTAIFLLILAAFTMGETLIWMISTFLPETPVLPLLLFYTILCILLATTNLQTIAMVNVLILFWIVMLGFFIAFTNMQVKDYELLHPFFEHGFQPVLTTAVFPASGFVEIILFLFIQQQVKDQIRWYHFAIMLFILMGLTMGPTIGAITEFGPTEVTKQRFPAYEEWGIGSVGRFIEHFDFASIYQWLSGTFIRVSLLLFIAADLLKMTGDKQRIWKILAPAFFFMALSLNLLSDDLFHSIKGDYLLIVTFFFMFFLSFILVIIALLSRKSSKKIKT